MAMRWGKLYKGTPAEHALEPAVAALGLAYRTQFPGYLFGFRFFPDVFFPQLGLIMEVDDPSHNRAKKMLEDEERTAALEARGWRVVRTTNEKALTDPYGSVRAMLAEAGITQRDIDAAKRRPLAGCLPVPKKAGRTDRAKLPRRQGQSVQRLAARRHPTRSRARTSQAPLTN